MTYYVVVACIEACTPTGCAVGHEYNTVLLYISHFQLVEYVIKFTFIA